MSTPDHLPHVALEVTSYGKGISLDVFYVYEKKIPDTWEEPGSPEVLYAARVFRDGAEVTKELTEDEKETVQALLEQYMKDI